MERKNLEEKCIIGKDDENSFDDFFKFASELLNIKYENGFFDFDEFDRQCQMDLRSDEKNC